MENSGKMVIRSLSHAHTQTVGRCLHSSRTAFVTSVRCTVEDLEGISLFCTSVALKTVDVLSIAVLL